MLNFMLVNVIYFGKGKYNKNVLLQVYKSYLIWC